MATTVTNPATTLRDPSRSRMARLAAPLTVGSATATATVALHFRNPNVQGSWGVCPTALLGFDCPACGSLRAVYHLTNVDLIAAASSNLLFVLFVPIGLLLWLRRLRGAWLGGGADVPPRVPTLVWAMAILVTVAFTVARNLPQAAWLHS